jgi:hypothetical protein
MLDTGHIMDSIDTSKVFRIICQNPNGLCPHNKKMII